MRHTHFPLFIDMRKKKILVIGAGSIATRRIQTLLEFEGQIKVISRDATAEIIKLDKDGILELELRDVEKQDLEGIDLLLMCTDDTCIQQTYVEYAKELNILVNACDNRESCDFYFPAIGTADELVLGLIGDGRDHKKVSRKIKELRVSLTSEMEEDGEN